jgi:23S rRNA (uracil1939-C5)-methyltransferase
MSPADPARITLQVDRLGAQGDGVAVLDGRDIYIPFALPGETISARIEGARALDVEILAPAPDRHAPRCPHYQDCGGCGLQHLPDAAYLAFKHRLVVDTLASRGLEADVAPIRPVSPRSRRRAALAAARIRGAVVLGFHGRREHRIVPVTDCTVLDPAIQAELPMLARLVEPALPGKGSIGVLVTATRTGLDIALNGVERALPADRRMRAIERAAHPAIARLSINGEVVLQARAPAVRMGEAWVTPPPGGFLQAAEPAERALVGLVRAHVGDSRRIADLFAGSGAFSLALASTATVHAVESDAAALAALKAAAQATPALKPVTTEHRDLFRRPLTPEDLRRFDAVVLDPPRAGAEDQCVQLARATVPRVAMVSCNAATLARDLRILVDGGYRLGAVTPVDQFLWSPHIEIVAVLTR